MMNCKQATRLLSDAQERELTFTEKATLTIHTAMCSGCRNFGKQMGLIRGISKEYVYADKDQGKQDDV